MEATMIKGNNVTIKYAKMKMINNPVDEDEHYRRGVHFSKLLGCIPIQLMLSTRHPPFQLFICCPRGR